MRQFQETVNRMRGFEARKDYCVTVKSQHTGRPPQQARMPVLWGPISELRF